MGAKVFKRFLYPDLTNLTKARLEVALASDYAKTLPPPICAHTAELELGLSRGQVTGSKRPSQTVALHRSHNLTNDALRRPIWRLYVLHLAKVPIPVATRQTTLPQSARGTAWRMISRPGHPVPQPGPPVAQAMAHSPPQNHPGPKQQDIPAAAAPQQPPPPAPPD